MSSNRRNLSYENLSTPGIAPGAVQGLSEIGIIAAAIVRSAGLESSNDFVFSELINSLLTAGAADEEAYWRPHQRKQGNWRRKTPIALADLCNKIVQKPDAYASANPIDVRVGKLVLIAVKAACEMIADHNEPIAGSSFSIPAAWQSKMPLLPIARADGCWLETTNGDRYFDASSGLWNVPLGHGHPDPLSGFIAQASSAAALNPFMQTSPVLHRLSDHILELCQLEGGGVFLCSSGSEAIETAFRLGLAVAEDKCPVWAQPGAFHGATMGASMLSNYTTLWREFSRIQRFVKHAAPSKWDVPGLGFVEPIRLGAGVRRTEDVASLVTFRDKGGIVVADEVASGIGRTFWPIASNKIGVPYDIVVLGKGLANGVVPVSCVVVSENILSKLSEMGTDFGHTHSNHLASAGAVESTLKALARIDHELFAGNLFSVMRNLSCNFLIEGATGAIILEKTASRATVDEICRDEGVVLHLPTVVNSVDRLIVAPPLTTNEANLEELGYRLKRAVQRIEVNS